MGILWNTAYIKGFSCFSKTAVGMSGTSSGSTNWVKEQSIKVFAKECAYQGAYIVWRPSVYEANY